MGALLGCWASAGSLDYSPHGVRLLRSDLQIYSAFLRTVIPGIPLTEFTAAS